MDNKYDSNIIGIDLGIINSYIGILRNNNIEIIPDPQTGEKRIPSIVCFKHSNECLIGRSAKNNMLEYPNLTISNSIKLLGLKFSDKIVQEDIKNLPVKIIEDKKTGKPQYVIKIGNEEKKYFPEDITSMILNYLKGIAEIFNSNKEINKVIIAVPINFNNCQINDTINASRKAGFKEIKIIYKPIAAAYSYMNMIKLNKKKIILIFDLDKRSFNVSIVKINNNNYNVFTYLDEENFGDDDFTQILIDYVIEIIKKDKKFKIDFENKNNKKVIHILKRIIKRVKEVKYELLYEKESRLFIDNFYGIEDLIINIKRSEYEEICIDLFNKCFKIVHDTIEKAKIKKEEIDEIILVGNGTRTPKIKEMIEKFFNKKSLQKINPEEVVIFGTVLLGYQELNIETHIENYVKSDELSLDHIDISFF